MLVKKKTKRIILGDNDYVILIESGYEEKCKHCELLNGHACLNIRAWLKYRSLFSICSTMGSYVPKFLKYLGMTLKL